MKQKITLFIFTIFSFSLFSQDLTEVSGVVVDETTNMPLQGVLVKVEGTALETFTDSQGIFVLPGVREGSFVLHIEAIGYLPKNMPINPVGSELNLGTITLEKDVTQDLAENLITLTENDLTDDESGSDATSGLLQATRDIFLSRAAFDFGQAFFRVRGYDSQEGTVLINGLPMNKLFNGRPQWNNWGGLNDVTRYQEFTHGITVNDYTFGGILGTTNISTRASQFRPGLRLSASSSNRTYTGRLMATYNSGLQANGLAYSISASRRWAEEGYIDGTVYDAFSLFGALEYKLNERHSINAMAMYAPNRRGSSTAITQEVYELVGRRYNPNWGFQDGDIRNVSNREIEEPIFMLSHFFNSGSTRLTTNVAYQFGKTARGRFAFQDIRNPNPVYYRNLPSYYLNLESGPDLANAQLAREAFLQDPQIDWLYLYEINNRNNSGGRSLVATIDDRVDDKLFAINSIVNANLNQHVEIDGGITFRSLKSENFAEITDLLGGEFFFDFDDFTQTSNDLLGNPVKITGDRFNYNYNINSNVLNLFTQAQFNYHKVSFFVSGSFTNTDYQREGLFLNELNSSNSLGKGEKVTFSNGAAKTGLTYRISGRHIISFNAGYITRAPGIRTVYQNPRYSGDLVPNLKSEKITTADASYILRMPYVRARLTGFYTKYKDASKVSFFFADFGDEANELDALFSESVTGIDQQHLGAELGVEVQVTPTVKISAVANKGQYTYLNNDARLFLYTADDTEFSGTARVRDLGNVYLKNFKVASGPQTAYSIGLEYRDPKFWWVGATANYLADSYLDVSSLLRTEQFFFDPDDIDGFPFEGATPEAVRALLQQEKFNNFYLVNLVGGKSWRVKNKFISLFASVNNLLAAEYKTGGFEQSRNANFGRLTQDLANGTPSFGPRYFFGFGRTYFVNLAVSF